MVYRPYPRSKRVSELLLEEIGWLIEREIKDPRVGFVTLTKVEVSNDLRHAKVFVSIMGGQAERESSLEGLRSALGYIKMRLGKNLRMKVLPDIRFVLDTSLDRVRRIEELIRETRGEG